MLITDRAEIERHIHTEVWNEIVSKHQELCSVLIEIPTGENTLKITATDINGQESVYQKEYTRIGDINIEITAELSFSDSAVLFYFKKDITYFQLFLFQEGIMRILLPVLQHQQ